MTLKIKMKNRKILFRMSFQWTLAATFLYMEVFVIILLLLPLISPQSWQKIFKSRLMIAITSYAGLYFNMILIILGLLLVDAIREIIKYSHETPSSKEEAYRGISIELVKELRAQRNFHISGTALFLWFVIKRLFVLISNTAFLIAESEASRKQAESANRTANSFLNEKDNTIIKKNEDLKTDLKNEEIKSLTDELISTKKQNENLKSVYDNLLNEYAKIEAALQKYEKSVETKKNF